MKVTRTSPFSGKTMTLDLDITAEQARAYGSGLSVQEAFPQLNADEREFILTGIMPGEWETYLPSE